MGFHDVDWAYSIDRPLAETAVLAALCHRTDDATHETFVGQEAVAKMLGSSPEKVQRALKALAQAGVITRTRRHGAGGYRTSDLIRVNIDTYWANHLLGKSPTGQITYQENRRDLPDDSSAPTGQIVTAEEINQIDQPEDHSVPPVSPDRFDEFYAIWPRQRGKPSAQRAWSKAVKRNGADAIISAAIAYRDNPYRPESHLIPYPATWLNDDRFNDDLDGPRGNGRHTPSERAQQTLTAGQQILERRGVLTNVTTLTPKRELAR